MKPQYFKTKPYIFILSLFLITSLISCGTMQTVSSSDGIYDDEVESVQTQKPQPRVVVADNTDNRENYFRKEVERLENFNNSDVFTDIDNYKSDTSDYNYEEDVIDEEAPETRITYNSNDPWGYNSNSSDVVINVNTYPNWGFYNDWGWDTYYGYNYRPWWRPRYYNNWGYNSFWSPYDYGFYNSGFYIGWNNNNFYCPPYYRNNFYGSYNYYTRRGANPYRGYTTRRRGALVTSRRASNSYIRNNRSSYSRRNTRSTRGSSRTYNSTNRRSTRNTRGYNTRRTSRRTDGYTRGNRTYRSSRSTRSSNYNTRSNNKSYKTGGHKPTRSSSVKRSTRSSRSYSTPSRSTRSYSAPSRSSSNRSSSSSRSSRSRRR
ncbi:hypothetical protein [Tenacibaculum sp. nBUS_03]|uniref:hypothetical protein n=1 Tax=Tenacibaculum sp. nBUS_03 TaxID=3395320 RepID=UPI003EBB749A